MGIPTLLSDVVPELMIKVKRAAGDAVTSSLA